MAVIATLSLSNPPPTLLIKCAGITDMAAMAQIKERTGAYVCVDVPVGFETTSCSCLLDKAFHKKANILSEQLQAKVHSYAMRPVKKVAKTPNHAGT